MIYICNMPAVSQIAVYNVIYSEWMNYILLQIYFSMCVVLPAYIHLNDFSNLMVVLMQISQRRRVGGRVGVLGGGGENEHIVKGFVGKNK